MKDINAIIKELKVSKIDEDLLNGLQNALGKTENSIARKQYVEPKELDTKFVTLILYDNTAKSYTKKFTDNLLEILVVVCAFSITRILFGSMVLRNYK